MNEIVSPFAEIDVNEINRISQLPPPDLIRHEIDKYISIVRTTRARRQEAEDKGEKIPRIRKEKEEGAEPKARKTSAKKTVEPAPVSPPPDLIEDIGF